ncbi:ComF family protein [Uliginosibacterium sp. 31-16]|uniref:ComF family protein n=1 Tax=Uliginosibacterium sp. 31-16 TaxID=3068315 RepID=UPI00273D6F2D|nr:ComF family protein [Uliginosibacterium sp. 31-16]MDP5240755.1 ComF family protein [Uliginosibacterium sp. 31-16]
MAYVLDAAISTAWPRECFVCGEAAGAFAVCHACEPILLRLPAAVCPRCALPAPVEGMLCGACQRRPPCFDATRAVFVYTHPVREMVLALKHGQGFVLLDWLGQAMSGALNGLKADCIIPTPLHPRRLAERGFNQSGELARRVAKTCGLPLWREAVVRDVDTPKFAGMRGKQRRRAVRGIFRCVEDFSGQHVVLLDDVMTSGATLDELARTLKQRGAVRVTNLVLARTLRVPRK